MINTILVENWHMMPNASNDQFNVCKGKTFFAILNSYNIWGLALKRRKKEIVTRIFLLALFELINTDKKKMVLI